MAARFCAGAAFDESCAEIAREWDAVRWQKVQKNVRRLQARIVKAVQGGRWGGVKAVQHLLTHSLNGKVHAVKRVEENKGTHNPSFSGTPGPATGL